MLFAYTFSVAKKRAPEKGLKGMVSKDINEICVNLVIIITLSMSCNEIKLKK